jgi:hypothetical protein
MPNNIDWEAEVERIYAHLRTCTRGVTVFVQQHHGPTAVYCLPPRTEGGEPTRKNKDELTKPMRKIMLVIPDDGTPWPVAKIATATGYEEGPHLRTALAALVKMGLLANDNEGYRAV